MAWVMLLFAGLFEVVWAIGLKYTEGFSRLVPSLITFSAMLISFSLFSQSLKSLPIGTAYSVWVGIGAVGTVIYGLFFIGEPMGIIRLICIAMIIVAIIGLKVST